MYTRCPACRSEIRFEAPANAASLPEGYKHRIKCPNCGVTIGVKIHQVEAQATYTPQYVEETSQAVVVAAEAEPKRQKKSGVGRNIVVMILSLLLIGLNVVGYLVAKRVIDASNMAWLRNFTSISGIYTIGNLFAGTPLPSDTMQMIKVLLPIVLFGLACINFLVAFIAACGKKYGRAWNVISAILILAVAVLILVFPLISGEDFVLANSYGAIAAAAIGALNFIFSLIFTKRL